MCVFWQELHLAARGTPIRLVLCILQADSGGFMRLSAGNNDFASPVSNSRCGSKSDVDLNGHFLLPIRCREERFDHTGLNLTGHEQW